MNQEEKPAGVEWDAEMALAKTWATGPETVAIVLNWMKKREIKMENTIQ